MYIYICIRYVNFLISKFCVWNLVVIFSYYNEGQVSNLGHGFILLSKVRKMGRQDTTHTLKFVRTHVNEKNRLKR